MQNENEGLAINNNESVIYVEHKFEVQTRKSSEVNFRSIKKISNHEIYLSDDNDLDSRWQVTYSFDEWYSTDKKQR